MYGARTVRARGIVVLGIVGLLVVALTPAAGARRPSRQPLAVAGASVTQSARQVVWRLRLTTPFSPGALRRAGRSLCLLVERSRSGAVTGQLCVIGPRPGGRSARVVYQRVSGPGPGHAKVVAANVTRSGSAQLTVSLLPGAFDNDYGPIRWQVRNTLQSPACARGRPGPPSCSRLYPARPRLAALHTPQVVGCVPSGPAYVTNGPSDKRQIALTFDDGPWYDTPQFLDILERYQVPATFFEIGEQIGTYGQGGAVERRMLADGDMIADHTWSHPNVAAGGAFARGQIEQTAGAIRSATNGFTPCLFRAPYGAVSPGLISEARSLGFTTIQWDIDPRDWSVPGVGEIVSNVLRNAHPGAIILQHDGGGYRGETLTALPQEISTLEREGYTFVTITQLLGQRLIYR